MQIVKNIEEFADTLWATPEQLHKAIFRGTTCGASIDWNEEEVWVGSIVEGSDAETETHHIKFPCDVQDIWEALTQVEAEAEIIWQEWNEEYETYD